MPMKTRNSVQVVASNYNVALHFLCRENSAQRRTTIIKKLIGLDFNTFEIGHNQYTRVTLI